MKCPYCAEEIQNDAKKCRYCGEWLNSVTPRVEKDCILCPNCGHSNSQSRVSCKKCGLTLKGASKDQQIHQITTVTSIDKEDTDVSSKHEEEASPFLKPTQEKTENSETKTQKPSYKRCPACKGELPEDAIKCKNCGKDLRSWFRKHPVLTFLLVLFVIGYLAKTLSKNKESSTTAPSSSSSKSAELREFTINETISVGYVGYQVFGVKWKDSIGEALRQSPDAKFLVIDIGIVNVDKEPRTVPPFKLVDDQGREYEESSGRIFLDGAIGLLKSLNPNVATRGYLVFDVPKGDYKLLLSGGYWSSDKAIVRLN